MDRGELGWRFVERREGTKVMGERGRVTQVGHVGLLGSTKNLFEVNIHENEMKPITMSLHFSLAASSFMCAIGNVGFKQSCIFFQVAINKKVWCCRIIYTISVLCIVKGD